MSQVSPYKIHVYGENVANGIIATVTLFATSAKHAINKLQKDCGKDMRFITDEEMQKLSKK